MGDKKTVVILIVAAVLILGAAAYFLFFRQKAEYKNTATELPNMYVDTNPMANQPDLNPVDASNPYASIKTNPFK